MANQIIDLSGLTLLGQSGVTEGNLETFSKPIGLDFVTMTSNEFTSLCPVTGQPDFQTVEIIYSPLDLCLESKSLKLYLWTYRNKGAFCEQLACDIAKDVWEATKAKWVTVHITQNPRGGIGIKAEARYPLVEVGVKQFSETRWS